MLWCQEYAWHNRSFMRDLMIDIVEDVTKASVALDESVNIHHNFCQCERCTYTVSPFWPCRRLRAFHNALTTQRAAEEHQLHKDACLQDPKSGATVERDLYVTRKGATPAAKGQMGLIPGSMGDPSFPFLLLCVLSSCFFCFPHRRLIFPWLQFHPFQDTMFSI